MEILRLFLPYRHHLGRTGERRSGRSFFHLGFVGRFYHAQKSQGQTLVLAAKTFGGERKACTGPTSFCLCRRAKRFVDLIVEPMKFDRI